KRKVKKKSLKNNKKENNPNSGSNDKMIGSGMEKFCKTIIITVTLEDNNNNNNNNKKNNNDYHVFPLDMAGVLKFLPTIYHQDERFSVNINSTMDQNNDNSNSSNENRNKNKNNNSRNIKNNIIKIKNKFNELTLPELMKTEDL